MPEVKILPPGKAYGYDRDTLRPADRAAHDNRIAQDKMRDGEIHRLGIRYHYNDHDYKVES